MSLTLERGPKTEEELWWLTQALWGHCIPRTKVCDDHDAPFDAFATAYFAREPQILIHGSRGLSGKSRTLSILGLTMAAVMGGDVNILGGSLNQSNNIHQTMRDAWDSKNAPKYMVEDDSMSMVKLSNGAKIRPLTASQKTVRGPHPPFLLLDEIDEMDQAILDAAKGQPMPQKNWRGEILPAITAMSSTWQYPDKTFASEYRRFQEENLPIFTWCAVAGTVVSTQRGDVPIEEITTDDRVAAWNGSGFDWAGVSWAGKTKRDRVVTVRTASGRRLSCTADHEVLTAENVYVQAGALREGQLVRCGVPVVQPGAGGTPVQLGEADNGHVSLMRSEGETQDQARALPVWGEEASSVQGVQSVLDERDLSPKQSESLNLGQTAGGGSPKVEAHWTGGSVCGVADSTGDRVRGAGTHRDVHGRFSLCGDGSCGDLRLAPHAASCAEEGQDQDAETEGPGLRGDRALVHQLSSLVAGVDRVVSVEFGEEEVDVYDISVPRYHNFVAEGIVVHNCFRETSNPVDGWLNPDFIEQKKREIPAEMWRVEYELGEPSIGNRAFDSEAVEKMFSLPVEPNIKLKRSKDFLEICWEEPRMDKEYLIAADWAKAQDFTVISVFDGTHLPIRPVYQIRMRRRPYPVMIGAYNDLMKRYNADGIHDATGLGGVVADYIDKRAFGFMMTGSQRDNMLSDYIAAVENGKILAQRVDEFYKAHLYCSVEDVYSRGKEFHLPDEVCSYALAWNLMTRRAHPSEPIMLPNTADPNWMDGDMRHNKERESSSWTIGAVRDKTSEAEQEFNLMV